MEVIIAPDPDSASRRAAALVAALVQKKPNAVLGLATGSTPLRLYQELIRRHREEGLDFSGVLTFNLDEYLGLAPSHPGSYHHFMRANFFDPMGMDPARSHIPSGLVKGDEVSAECARYEELIRAAGGIDVQILGIGSDGHIGFNEPGSSLASRTRIKTLTRRTREDNARFFSKPEDVPHHVLTMGIGSIMDARQILLLAFGKGKAEAVAGAVEGPVTAGNPASILQMHPDVKVLVDEEAAANLRRSDYYRWVYDNKPDWQRVEGDR